jgi:molybdopterin converting factor small subunit
MNRRHLLAATLLAALVCCVIGSTLTLGQETPPAPGEDKATTAALPEREVSARIDAEIKKVWDRDSVKPADECSDEEFVRRVYLDTVGAPPKAEEVEAFLADKNKEKRRALIDTLVADPRFGRHMADEWSVILLGRAGRDYGGSSHLFAIWLAERINANHKFSDVVYDIVVASGSVSENPATAVYTREVPFKVANSAGNTMKNLTGVQLQCAECHDHPYEEAWKEETFTGMASFWMAVQVRVNPRIQPVDPSVEDEAAARALPDSAMDRLPAEAQNRQIDLKRYNKPVTMDGDALKTTNRKLWRPAIAKWMVADENKQTARYMANRFWSFAFGIGIHNPIDDFNSFNEASHPELLEFLAQDFIDNDYDIKRLYRSILNTRTYQLTSKDAPKAEGWHFAGAPVRQMNAEQFFGSLMEIAGGSELTKALRTRNGSVAQQIKRRYEASKRRTENGGGDNQREYTFDEETMNRIVAWYDKMDDSWFMRRNLAQDYARVGNDDEMVEQDGFSLTIDQALLVMNGEVTAALSGSTRGSTVWKLVNEIKTDDARIEKLYLTVFGRKPDSDEQRTMKAYVKGSKNATEAYEDIMFALLASTEFATNH